MTAELKLLGGQTALIDAEDLPKVKGFKWRLSAYGYVVATVAGSMPQKTVWLHRIILGTLDGLATDHKNHNALDNRKANLRSATSTQNNGNRRKRLNMSSKFKGVTWSKCTKRWKSQISQQINGRHKTVYLGYFDDEKTAALAYNAAAKSYFGDFALVNRI